MDDKNLTVEEAIEVSESYWSSYLKFFKELNSSDTENEEG